MPELPIAIIGAGPIGLEVAVALRREGLPVVQFDAGQVGQTFTWWAPGTRFFSSPERIAIAGLPLVTLDQAKASREEYLAHLRQAVLHYGLEIRTFEPVERIEGRSALRADAPDSAHEFTITTAKGSYPARAVVAAIGDMHRPRLLNIPGEDLPHCSHYLADPHRYFRRRVLIVGGRNSAVEAAIRLYRVGASVAVSYRCAEFDEKRVKYWLLPEIKGLIKGGQIAFMPETRPVEIIPGAALIGRAGGGITRVEADDILLLTGYEMDGSLLAAAGVILDGPQGVPRHNPRTMETDVPGLYVAGTAAGGTQVRHRLFIETCHVHADRIAAALTGRVAAAEVPEHVRDMPEA